jgi:hypothetical protein
MRKALSLLVLPVVVGLMATGRGKAQHVDADPNKDYPVTPEAGPWMVLVATYTGPDRASLAKQMAYKIRADLDKPAYVFVYVDKERLKQKQQLENANRMAEEYLRREGTLPPHMKWKTIRVEEQYGVLIGGWADADMAKAYLDAKIRTIKNPPLLVSAHGAEGYDTAIQIVRDSQGRPIDEDGRPIVDPQKQRPKYERVRLNPFATAIVTRNPSLPSAPVAKTLDPAVIKFNADEEYSLLNCPAKCTCTLLVKEYIGATTVQNMSGGKDRGFLSALWFGSDKPGETLAAAGHDAHELARTLRQLNLEAYVLHGRTSSIVTIGGFSGPDDPGAQRVTQQLAQLRQQMAARSPSDPLKLFPVTPMIMIPGRESE